MSALRLVFVFFAICVFSSGLAQARDDTLRIVMPTAPGTLDPHYATASQDAVFQRLLFGTLFEYDRDGKISAMFAEGLDAEPEDQGYILTLKPDILWSDGTKFTSRDVVYSVQRYARLAREGAVENRSKFNFVDGFVDFVRGEGSIEAIAFQAIDGLTIKIGSAAQREEIQFFMSDMNWAIVPQHAVELNGEENWSQPEILVTSGAFSLNGDPDSPLVTFAPNPNFYFRDDVALSAIEIYFPTPEKSVMHIAQEIAAHIVLRPDAEIVEFAEKLYPERVKTFHGHNVESLNFNMESAAMQDERVRQALSLAIDYEAVVERAGFYSVRHDALSPALSGHLNELFYRPVAERKSIARALLAEAGFDEKTPLVISFGSYETQSKRKYVKIIVQDWIEIGVQVKPFLHDKFSELDAESDLRLIDVFVVGWGGQTVDPSFYLVQVQDAGASVLNLNQPELEARIERALAPGDLQFKARETDAILREFTEKYYSIPILSYGTVHIVAPEVKNFDGQVKNIWRTTIEAQNVATVEN